MGGAGDGCVAAGVVDPEEGEFLVIIELQLRPDPRMAIRLEAYAALAEEKFGLPVYAVVVIILLRRGGDDVELLAGVLDRLRRTPELAGMETLLAHFAGLVLGKEADAQSDEVEHGDGDWHDLLRGDSQRGDRVGMERGVEQGLVQGVERGAERGRQTARRFVQRVLVRRFGTEALQLSTDMARLDLDALEGLLDVAESAPDLESFREALFLALR